ncbi:MAG: EAL domain-containing protein [Hyphomicrobiales bacterium]|nr:MAG: EAL domain-containing protein [Hyphomicrobiales bacterium]
MAPWRSHVFVLVLLCAAALTGAAGALHGGLIEWRFSMDRRAPTGTVAVVAIDSRTLDKIGVWPWPRHVYAEILDKLQALGVTEVAFDIDFSARSTPEDDHRFATQLEAFGGAAILPMFKQVVLSGPGGAPIEMTTKPRPDFARHAWVANVNVSPDKDGRVRAYNYDSLVDGEDVPSLAALLSGVGGSGAFMVDFGIKASAIPVVSVIDILENRVPAEDLRDRKVIIGATAIELGDRFAVPVAGILPGVTLQALAAETLIQKRALKATSLATTLIGLALIAALAALLRRRKLSLAAVTAVLVPLSFGLEGVGHLLHVDAAVVLDTAYWQLAIWGYLAAAVLSDLGLRRLVADIAQSKFQSVAVSLGDGIICTDAAGLVSFWNPAAETIFGRSSKEAQRQPFAQFVSEPASLDAVLEGETTSRAIELTGVRQDGSHFPLEIRASGFDAEDGRNHSFVVRDISERREAEARIRFLALHDALTGLPNHNSLREALRERIETAGTAAPFALLTLGIDNFKEVNDRLGHDGGDRLLRDFAERLAARFPAPHYAARLGGDEFAVIVALDNQGLDAAVAAAGALLGDGSRHTLIDGHGFRLSASVGSVRFPEDGDTVDDLLSHAGLALFQAKSTARGGHAAYDVALKDEIERRRAMEERMKRAFDNGEFELYYQPQVRLHDGKLVGAEALLRWHSGPGEIAQPAAFMDVLSRCSVTPHVGAWTLRTACAQAAAWHRAGRDICIGVNLFPIQFAPSLVAEIRRVLEDTGLPPHLLEIEITENILLTEDERTTRLLGDIRALGVRVALDDFGTGFASLTHLKKFPLDRLKIDRSFVTDFGADARDTAIVNAVLAIGAQLGIDTIAEGIEDAACGEALSRAGCGEAQGYHYGRPMPAAQFEALLDLPRQAVPSAA